MQTLLQRIHAIESNAAPADLQDPQLVERLRLRDMMITQRQVLSAMLFDLHHDSTGVTETRSGVTNRRPAHPIPERELWFERVFAASNHSTRP